MRLGRVFSLLHLRRCNACHDITSTKWDQLNPLTFLPSHPHRFFKVFSTASAKTSTCFSPKVNIGLNLTVRSPHPPIWTPFFLIPPKNASRSSVEGMSHAKKVAESWPRKLETRSVDRKTDERADERSAPVAEVCVTRS